MKRIILLSLLIFTIFSAFVFAQNSEKMTVQTVPADCISDEGNVLERRNCLVKWENTYFSYAVRDIFWLTDVPYGMSVAFENAVTDEIKINSTPKKTVVKDLLDEVIKYDSRYQWNETNGVVNVSPKNDYPIMDVRIAEFKIDILFPAPRLPITKDTQFPILNELEKKLIETKEFQAYLKERNLLARTPNADKHGFMCCGFVGKPVQTRISIDLKNATVREILNEIVRQRGFGWTYQEFNVIDEGKLYHIFRLEI